MAKDITGAGKCLICGARVDKQWDGERWRLDGYAVSKDAFYHRDCYDNPYVTMWIANLQKRIKDLENG